MEGGATTTTGEHRCACNLCIAVKISSISIDGNLLVGGLEPWNFMTFHILGISIPIDFHIFQRG